MGVFPSLADAPWLTRERIRIYSIASLLIVLLSVGYVALTAQGVNDYQGRPLGVDFANVYAAGSYANQGLASYAFDPALQFVREKQIFGADTQLYGWHYPPLFLCVAAVLAALPYLAALVLWELGTFAAYVIAMRWILPMRAAVLPICGFTAVWVNAMNGNNGFLTAALLGGALALLPTRQILAGVLIGLLAYKPQYGVLVPLALLAGGYWRSFIMAALTVLLLGAVSLLAYGTAPWEAFVHFLPFTRVEVLEQGSTGFYKMQSLFAWVRMLGGGVAMAYMAQAVLSIAVIGAVVQAWGRPVAYEVKAALLLLGSLLVTPYVLDYDLVLLGPALAFMACIGLRDGFLPYEKALLCAAWGVPLIARNIAQATFVFPGFLATALLFLIVLRRLRQSSL